MKTKLLFLFITGICSAALLAQVPTPVASFPFDTDLLDENQNVLSENMGAVTIVDDAVRGKVMYVPAGPGNAAPDSNNYLKYDYAAGCTNYSEVSYSIWFNCNTVNTWSRILTVAAWGPEAYYPEFFITPANGRLGGRLSVSVDCGSVAGIDHRLVEIPYSDAAISAGTWYHIVATLNATNMKFYVDGVLVADSAHTSGAPNTWPGISWMCTGRAGWPDPLPDTYFDNFKIFDKVLSDAEVTAIYDAEQPGASNVKQIQNSPDLVVYNLDNQIYIRNQANMRISSIQVYNVTGSMVLRRDEYNGAIRHNLPPSVYIIRVQSDLGDYISKIIIE